MTRPLSVQRQIFIWDFVPGPGGMLQGAGFSANLGSLASVKRLPAFQTCPLRPPADFFSHNNSSTVSFPFCVVLTRRNPFQSQLHFWTYTEESQLNLTAFSYFALFGSYSSEGSGNPKHTGPGNLASINQVLLDCPTYVRVG